MRKKKNRRILPLLAAMIGITISIGLAADMAEPAFAAGETTAAINLGSDLLKTNCNTTSGPIVKYGGEVWRVIGYDGSGAVSEKGAATLLADYSTNDHFSFYSCIYYSDSDFDLLYETSVLRTGVDKMAKRFSEGELGAITKRTLKCGEFDGDNTDCIKGERDLTDVSLWPLSTKEAGQVNSDLRILESKSPERKYGWWLRSPGSDYRCAGTVMEDGSIDNNFHTLGYVLGTRPAFYLNLGAVLFTSEADGGKDSSIGSLTKVGEGTGTDWKFTVKDSSHSNFSAQAEQVPDGFAVSYSGAATGDNEFLSAIIVNSESQIKYYGLIQKCSSESDASGKVIIKTKGMMEEGDYLCVFNEQVNEKNQADLASDLILCCPEYIWADDNSTVTAVRINEYGKLETETVGTTSKETSSVFCVTNEEFTFTSEAFSNPAFEVQTKTVVTKYAYGHNWGPATYSWAEDNKNVGAKRVCRRQPREHIEFFNVPTTYKETKAPTCEERGEGVYTAEIKDREGFETQTKKVELDALGHDWGEWVETKAATTEADGLETRTCKRDPSHTETRAIPRLDHYHQLSPVAEVPASCTTSGTKDHYVCSECAAIFLDDQGKVQTSDDGIRIPAAGHSPGEPEEGELTPATCSQVGGYNLTTRCENCQAVLNVQRVVEPFDADAHDWGDWKAVKVATEEKEGLEVRTCKNDPDHQESKVIPRIDPSGSGDPVSIQDAEVVLSGTAFTYTGKVIKPQIRTIGESTLKADTDYTATWPDAKAVGSYAVTITGTGHYTGTSQATYQINPKGTTLKKAKAAKKAATIKWKKQAAKMTKSRISGYQIQLATNSKFTKNKKTVKVKGCKKVSKKVTKLKGGKKYYVKIRTYMTTGGKTYYSPWSKAKTVKIKK
ncbi:MAG: hypothetical protein IJ128_04905 [Firmicutes bacterium]|nr:hypothetical protein [Bacillota bacterium]